MKLVFLVGLLALFSGTSQAMPLGDAVREIIAEFRVLFIGMIGNWNTNALADTESCQTVHQLVDNYEPAWDEVRNNPGYQTLLSTLTDAGVVAEWTAFIQSYLQPGFGDIATLRGHTCAGTRGGNALLVTELRATFESRRPSIRATLERVRAASPEFEALFERIAAAQSEFTAVRCSAAFEPIGRIYRTAGFDVDGVAVIIGAVFGWTEILPC